MAAKPKARSGSGRTRAELEGELKRLAAERDESEAQKAALAEVLGVINASPGDLAPVFDAMLERALRLCDARTGHLLRYTDGSFSRVASLGIPEDFDKLLPLHQPLPHVITRDSVPYRTLATLAPINVADLRKDASYRAGAPAETAAVDEGGVRSVLFVPLLKDSEVVGNFVMHRLEVRPFTDKQIALLQTFAAQAVIAMENARLITETREALDQQTATAEVLGVINASPGDLKPVFDAILEKAHSLCGVTYGSLQLYDGTKFRAVAVHDLPRALADQLIQGYRPRPTLPNWELLNGANFVQVADIAAVDDAIARATAENGIRSLLWVALRKDGVLLGSIAAARREVQPFTDKQIALLEDFAAQAVIAMENARLLNETRQRTNELQESLEYQTATSDVLQVISRSTFDLQPVLETVAETAARLCASEIVTILRRHADGYRVEAAQGWSPEYREFLENHTFAAEDQGTLTGRVVLERRAVQVADITTDPTYALTEAVTLGKARTQLGVPLLREGAPIGVIIVSRQRVEPFTQKQIELVTTFADQAVIAIENARLITETREALEQQTATAEVLEVINSSPGDLTPVFDQMVEKATRLCEAAFGILLTYDGEHFHHAALRSIPDAYATFMRDHPPVYGPKTAPGRLAAGEDLVQVSDMTNTDAYRLGDQNRRAIADLAGARSLVAVPLRKESRLLGAIVVFRQEVRPFSDKQIALLQNFAAQAVIAMENARLLTETREALEQQTATAEVLQVINASPGDLTPVFEVILNKAHALCGAERGTLFLYDGAKFKAAVAHGYPQDVVEHLRAGIDPVSRHEALFAGNHVHIPDLRQIDEGQTSRVVSGRGGVRTNLLVPLFRNGAVLGMISCNRTEVRPFSDKEIALIKNFAAQAVIAMENARLITETREALEQQTATAEILRVISNSPTDVQPVFDAIAKSAVALCAAASGGVFQFDGSLIHYAAYHGWTPGELDAVKAAFPVPADRGSITGRAIISREVAHVADVQADPEYALTDIARSGLRAGLSVPMMQEGKAIGAIIVTRQEPEPFTDRQVALIRTFAAQAVIAVENVRLFDETREALEQQTATAEVLGVINSNPGDLAPVFDAILKKAYSLCDASGGDFVTYDGQFFHSVAMRGMTQEFGQTVMEQPYSLPPEHPLHALVRGDQRVVHIADILVELAALMAIDPMTRAAAEQGGVRTVLMVPLRKDGTLLGVIIAQRREVRPFTEKEITLLEGFAAQAVIAMDNARLLGEVRQRQHELRVTFDNMADGVAMFDQELRLAAWNRNFEELLDLPDALLSERPAFDTYIRHLAERGEFGDTTAEAEIARLRSRLGDHYSFERTRPDGTVVEVRHNPMPDGGVVLIYSDITERKRSEEEIRAARDAAEAAYRDLQAAQANLVQAQKMAALGQLTAGIAHEIKNPLNFVNNFASISVELLDELKETAAPALATLDEDKRADVDDTMELLTGNLEKIAEHGKRADNIVKSMLEHSRGVSGDRREVDLNGVIEEALNLAYHGARAQDQSFNITLERDYAESLQPIELAPQEMTRVFLNLIGNGFYAATKRARDSGGAAYRPTLTVSTSDTGDAVEVRVRDNGTGIPAEIRDKLFQPFFTTKPTGEGTGLGLSISYDIVTQQHGGTITVESEPGAYTEFTIRLPRQ